MSGTEGQEPAGTDPIHLQSPRGAAGIGRVATTEQAVPQASTIPVTRLIAVRAIRKPLYERFKKIEDNVNHDFRKSPLSEEDLELSDQAYTLLALLQKRQQKRRQVLWNRWQQQQQH